MSFRGGNPHTFVAAGAVAQGRFVTIDANGEVAEAGADADAIGVSLEAAAAQGDVIAIAMIDGQTVVEVNANAAIAVGDDIGTAALGRAAVAAVGVIGLGYALSAAAAQDEFVSVLLQKRGADSP